MVEFMLEVMLEVMVEVMAEVWRIEYCGDVGIFYDE
jgi:hypothetical protein